MLNKKRISLLTDSEIDGLFQGVIALRDLNTSPILRPHSIRLM